MCLGGIRIFVSASCRVSGWLVSIKIPLAFVAAIPEFGGKEALQ